MDLKLCARPHGRHVVVKVFGEVDMFTAPQLRRFLLQTLECRGCDLILDCAELGFMDSSGLAVLVGIHRRAREAGGSLRLAVPAQPLADQLRVSGLHRLISTYPTVEAALACAAPAGSPPAEVVFE